MSEDFELIGLMCSRLCHDLVGPVGAIVNGMELIEDSGDDPNLRDQSLSLIGESANELAARLKFFRVSFGSGGGRLPFAASELREIAPTFLGGRRTSFTLTTEADQLDRPTGRLLLALSLIGGESLPQGGTLNLEYQSEGREMAVLTASGRRARPSPEFASLLAEGTPPEAPEARAAGAIFLWLLAQRAGVEITIEAIEGEVIIRLNRM